EGSVESLLLYIAVAVDNGGEFGVAIWENVDGEPGEILGTVTMNIAEIDLSDEGFSVGNLDGVPFGYNVSATFDAPIEIEGDSFWAGVIIPTTAAAGDTIALVSTQDGDFPDAATHLGEIYEDG